MAKEKYEELKELRFEKLKNKHSVLFEGFQTYQKELKNFLIEDALNSQDAYISTTYLVFDANDFRRNERKPNKLKLLGYVTLTNDSLMLDAPLKKRFREKGITYKSLPAIKIGRLCVDERHERKNIGKMIITHVFHRASHLNDSTACRFVTLDAKRHTDSKKDSLHFYRKSGFDVLVHKDKTRDELFKQCSGETPMYADIFHIIKRTVK